MSTPHGKFVWYELMTTDTAAAASFYSGVIGWKARDSGMPGMSYTIASVDEVPVCGMMELPEAAVAGGAKVGWSGYVAVDDVDATAARAGSAGGVVCREPSDIPGVGRFAVLADPQGAQFVAFKGMPSDNPAAPDPNKPGHTGWHELQAKDWESAFSFYSDLFGWTKDHAVDMGPMGLYQIFSAAGTPTGGMMTASDPHPQWRYYFTVDDIDAAAQRVKQHGGQVLSGPHEVPGGSWIVHGVDPQGASFAIVGRRA